MEEIVGKQVMERLRKKESGSREEREDEGIRQEAIEGRRDQGRKAGIRKWETKEMDESKGNEGLRSKICICVLGKKEGGVMYKI